MYLLITFHGSWSFHFHVCRYLPWSRPQRAEQRACRQNRVRRFWFFFFCELCSGSKQIKIWFVFWPQSQDVNVQTVTMMRLNMQLVKRKKAVLLSVNHHHETSWLHCCEAHACAPACWTTETAKTSFLQTGCMHGPWKIWGSGFTLERTDAKAKSTVKLICMPSLREKSILNTF